MNRSCDKHKMTLKFRLYFTIPLFFFIFHTHDLCAQPVAAEGVDIVGDKIEYQKETGLMIGEGNVVIRYQDSEIRADKLIYDNNTNIAKAVGRVTVLKPDGTTYSGEEAVYNFNTNLLEAESG